MARITSPVKDFNGVGAGNIVFRDGEADTDNERLIAYFRKAGYGVDGEPPRREQPQPPDPREVTTTVAGSVLRDAAVDPRPSDFRAPVNAGEANPHGPEVYAPGLPGSGLQPTAPPPDPDDTGIAHGDSEINQAGPDAPPPAQSAPVAEWRQWVLTNKVDNDPAVHAEVEKMTKAELVKRYGG